MERDLRVVREGLGTDKVEGREMPEGTAPDPRPVVAREIVDLTKF